MNERLSPLSLLCLLIVSNELLKVGVTLHILLCGLLHLCQKVYGIFYSGDPGKGGAWNLSIYLLKRYRNMLEILSLTVLASEFS